MREITIRLPDPAAYTWEERAFLRTSTADAVREVVGADVDVAVDVLPVE